LAGVTLGPPGIRAQEQDPAPLFASNDPIEITLTLPLRTLVAQRKRRPDLDGTVTLAGTDGTATEFGVSVSTRGFSRLELCSFPPLSLNFKRGQVDDTLFARQNRLKLVTLCRGTTSYEQYLELEYVVYRMYEQVSEFAFRIRPVRMRYVNTERNNDVEEAPAFFIEHKDGVAARVGMAAVDLPGIEPAELRPRELAILTLFQYMIGNTDWSATTPADGEDCCHNTAVLAPTSGENEFVIVPYDFDQSGFINTSYAVPSEKLPIRTVRERLYRGLCATNEYLDAALAKFNAARPAIESVLQSARLTEKSRADALDYIERSYEIINDPAERQREIVDECRGRS
jgi:hypothetical protein